MYHKNHYMNIKKLFRKIITIIALTVGTIKRFFSSVHNTFVIENILYIGTLVPGITK